MSRDEQRLLWITFVGGLASILVGAGIIGAAIVFARYEVRQNSVTWLAVVTLATPVAVVLWRIVDRLTRDPEPSKSDQWSNRIVTGLLTVLVCVEALAWLGFAAGVK